MTSAASTSCSWEWGNRRGPTASPAHSLLPPGRQSSGWAPPPIQTQSRCVPSSNHPTTQRTEGLRPGRASRHRGLDFLVLVPAPAGTPDCLGDHLSLGLSRESSLPACCFISQQDPQKLRVGRHAPSHNHRYAWPKCGDGPGTGSSPWVLHTVEPEATHGLPDLRGATLSGGLERDRDSWRTHAGGRGASRLPVPRPHHSNLFNQSFHTAYPFPHSVFAHFLFLHLLVPLSGMRSSCLCVRPKCVPSRTGKWAGQRVWRSRGVRAQSAWEGRAIGRA